MNYKISKIVIIFFIFNFLYSSETDITINTYTGPNGYPVDYLHLKFTLNKKNITLNTPKEWSRCHYCYIYDLSEKERQPNFTPEIPCPCNSFDISETGSFTLYINKDSFPIKTKSCASNWLKCQMPSTNVEAKNFDISFKKKKDIWDKIKAVSIGELDSVVIYIELSPYVEIINENPIEAELEYCNISFRTAFGGVYIDNIFSLSHPVNEKLGSK